MDTKFILISIAVFFVVILVLVAILLVAKRYLSPSGKVKVTINGKETIEVEQGSSVLTTLSENGIYLSSACGGKGLADNAAVKFQKVVEKFWIQKSPTSLARKSKTIGVWVVKPR